MTQDVHWTSQIDAIYGVEPGTIRCYSEFASRVHPDDAALVEAKRDEAIAQHKPFDFEFRIRRFDGDIAWIYCRGNAVYDEAGRPIRAFGINLDITERKRTEKALRESEERFRLGAAASHAMVYDLNVRTLEVNGLHGAASLLGFDATEIELTLQWWDRQIHPEDLEACHTAFHEMHTDPHDRTIEYRVRHQDGRILCVEDHATPVCDHAGQLVRIVGTVVDITQRKQAEKQLEQFNQQLEHLVSERTAVAERRAEQLRALAAELTQTEQKERQRLAGILHDHLQQLLVGTKFHLGVLRSSLEKAGQRKVLKQVDSLLDESLDASRSLTVDLCPPILQQGTMPQVLQWLAEWIHRKHGLTVTVQADEKAHPQAEDVRILLFNVVRELLFNVAKHAGVNQASVTLSRTTGGKARVVVSDAGSGFDPSRPDNRRGQSGGFGLFSIRERLDWIGGEVEIESAPGKGTRATVVVPIGLKAAAAEPPVPLEAAASVTVTATGAAGGNGQDRNKVRVLLADDHAVMWDGLGTLLASQPDIEVVGKAADGQQAVDLAAQLQPDVIIMDVNMPELDGKEATRQILARLPNTKIIGLSMFAESDVAEAMKAAGAVILSHLPRCPGC